ncbi:MAG: FAD-binding protein, partial [Desulfarculaceae bacterium]
SPSHGIEHVWIDLTHLPDYVHDVKLKEISGFFRKFANRNPKKELCPVRPSNHYHMGGIPTDENGRVLDAKQEKTERLFAIGECACASFHGFNRLATNSILELITMGKIVGQEVCKDLMHHQADPQKSLPESTSKEFNAFFEAKGKENIALLKDELRRTMTEKVGVFRTQKSLELAIDKLHELKTRADQVKLSTASLAMNQELVQRWEFENLLTVSLAIAEGALVREESRGGHYREDFPDRRDEFNHHTYMTMDDYGHFVFSERQIDMSIFHSEVEYSHHFGMIERKY